MPRKKRLHFKDLDALRFFAFLPVFAYCFVKHMSFDQEGLLFDVANLTGYLAINSLDFFFCLSAFLLTSHGLREYKYRESFSLKNYLIRRIFKITLLLIILLLFIFLGHPWLIKILKLQPIVVPSVSPFMAFVPNYLSRLNNEQHIYLVVTWSIYMFLQYYLIWGIVLKFFKAQLLKISIVLICVGVAARIVHVAMDSDWQFDTLCYGVPIGIGAIFGLMVRQEYSIIDRIKQFAKKLHAAIYTIGFIILFGAYLVSGKGYLDAFVPLGTSVFFGYIFIEQTSAKNSLFKCRNSRISSHIGKISYGMTVYQSIMSVLVLIAMGALDFDLSSDFLKFLSLVISFVLTWIVADVSFNLFERPLLVLRKEFKKT